MLLFRSRTFKQFGGYVPKGVKTVQWKRLGATLPELAQRCAQQGFANPEKLLNTIAVYSEAVARCLRENPAATWNPVIKDGLSTQSRATGLILAKSNWATFMSRGPFVAVKVTHRATFIFGGSAVDSKGAGVISSISNQDIPGLYCARAMLSLFYRNFPGGSGLSSRAGFDRRVCKAAVINCFT